MFKKLSVSFFHRIQLTELFLLDNVLCYNPAAYTYSPANKKKYTFIYSP